MPRARSRSSGRRSRFRQGHYQPKHPEKYVGTKIPTYRSGWEQRFMLFCDDNPNVKAWASEPVKIPYIDPFTGKRRNYIPDFLIQYVDKNGEEITEMIEIKPKKQTSLKEAGRSKRDQFAARMNEAKWRSAVEYCKTAGIAFRVVTEDQIFHNGKK